MPRWDDEDEPWDDDADEEDGFDDGGDDDPTLPCPGCGAAVYDDAERCPACGRYFSREDAPTRRPWWFVIGVGASLYVVYRWIIPR